MKIYAFADEASPKVDEQISAMLRNHLDGLEIRNVDGESVSVISVAKAGEVAKKLSDHGLRVWSIGSPIGKIDIEKDDFEKHLDVLRHTLDVAEALGTTRIRMFSFYIPKDRKPEEFRSRVMDRLAKMVEIASKGNFLLCHENEKAIFGDVASRCDDILRTVPGLKCVFDPANFIQVGQDVPKAWKLLKDRVYYLHIKDALADGSVVPAGNGIGHVPEILREYVSRGGESVTVEPHLTVFEGFASLERDKKTEIPAFSYPSSQAAFDAACTALHAILP